eukprot:7068216-Lingulodinium_polyedra.AAC.1
MQLPPTHLHHRQVRKIDDGGRRIVATCSTQFAAMGSIARGPMMHMHSLSPVGAPASGPQQGLLSGTTLSARSARHTGLPLD